MRWSRILLVATLIVFPGTLDNAAGDEAATPDAQALREVGVATDGPALVDFLRKRSLLAGDEEKIAVLVRQLGSSSYKVRSKATAALVARGSATLSALDRVLQDPDLEVARRAEQAMRRIRDKDTGPAVTIAAVRLLLVKKPPAAVETLLAFLPYAENDGVAEEVRSVLAALAAVKGQPDKVLVAALGEKHPVKRAAAAEALCQAGLLKELPAIRKLLADPEPSVRLRVALALAGAREKQAIPVLIDLLGQANGAQAYLAQDFLYRLAEDTAPTLSPGIDAASRARCRQAWTAWWRKQRDKIDLAKLSQKPRLLGYTVLVFLDLGRIEERDASGKQRWEVQGLQLPLDVQLLPGKRLLVTEHGASRITERNRKGTILWQKKIATPLMAQRLPNGNTFIGSRTELVEVDRSGKQVFSFAPRNGELFMRAQKLRNGDLACVLTDEMGNGAKFARLDTNGKEIYSFPVNVSTYGGRIEVLPNGQVLVPEMHLNRVVLYDKTGKSVWNARVLQPVAAVRLANGNTLVTTYNQNRAIELDKEGEEAAQFKADTRVNRAWRR
jgi:HEAT repeat protein